MTQNIYVTKDKTIGNRLYYSHAKSTRKVGGVKVFVERDVSWLEVGQEIPKSHG